MFIFLLSNENAIVILGTAVIDGFQFVMGKGTMVLKMKRLKLLTLFWL
jgi:hypothetical protein